LRTCGKKETAGPWGGVSRTAPTIYRPPRCGNATPDGGCRGPRFWGQQVYLSPGSLLGTEADDTRRVQGGGFCSGGSALCGWSDRRSGLPAASSCTRECQTSSVQRIAVNAPEWRRRQEARGALPESGGHEACGSRRGCCRRRGPNSSRGGGGGAGHVEKLGRPEGGPRAPRSEFMSAHSPFCGVICRDSEAPPLTRKSVGRPAISRCSQRVSPC